MIQVAQSCPVVPALRHVSSCTTRFRRFRDHRSVASVCHVNCAKFEEERRGNHDATSSGVVTDCVQIVSFFGGAELEEGWPRRYMLFLSV